MKALVNPSDLKDLKPKRKNFTKTIVIANNGAVVEDTAWRGIVGSVEGRELTKALKKNGLQPVKIFLKEQFEDAKVAFYAIKHATERELHSTTINKAFDQAGYPKVKRLETTLKSILPLFKKQPQAKTVATFKALIKAVGQAGVIQDIQDRAVRRQAKKTVAKKVRTLKTAPVAVPNLPVVAKAPAVSPVTVS